MESVILRNCFIIQFWITMKIYFNIILNIINMSKEEIINKSKNEWKNEVTTEQYQICRMKGTEPAFTGKYWNSKDNGIYKCVCCSNNLFSSETNLILVQVDQVFLLQSTKKM